LYRWRQPEHAGAGDGRRDAAQHQQCGQDGQPAPLRPLAEQREVNRERQAGGQERGQLDVMRGRAGDAYAVAALLERRRPALGLQARDDDVSREVELRHVLHQGDQGDDRGAGDQDFEQAAEPEPVRDAVGRGEHHAAEDAEIEHCAVGAAGLDGGQTTQVPHRVRGEERCEVAEEGPPHRLRAGHRQSRADVRQQPPEEQDESDDQRRAAEIGQAGQDVSRRDERQQAHHDAQQRGGVDIGRTASSHIGLG
jgi:hypothetical protein